MHPQPGGVELQGLQVEPFCRDVAQGLVAPVTSMRCPHQTPSLGTSTGSSSAPGSHTPTCFSQELLAVPSNINELALPLEGIIKKQFCKGIFFK